MWIARTRSRRYRLRYGPARYARRTRVSRRGTSPGRVPPTGLWSNGGKWIAYGSTRRTGDDVDIYVVEAYEPEERAPRPGADGRRLVRQRLVARRPRSSSSSESISINERYLWLVRRREQDEDAPHSEGEARRSPTGMRAYARDGKGLYVSLDAGSEFQRLAYLDLATKKTDFLTPDTARRRRLRPVARRQDARLRHQREGGQRPAPARHGFPARAAGPEAAARASISGFAVAPRRASRRVHHGLRPRRATDAYSLDVETGQGRAVDLQRDRGPERRDLRRAGARDLEELRRPRDLRLPLQAARDLHRQAARDHRHPRRARGPVPPRLSRAATTTSSTSSASPSSIPNVRGSTGYGKTLPHSSTTASCARAPYRTSARCSTGSGPVPISTRERIMVQEDPTAGT